MKKLTSFVMFLVMSSSLQSAELTHQFLSPSFNGIGFSSHALTIYNLELSRKLAVEAQKKAEQLKAEQDAANTPLARFITNLESRVFNELARQMVDRMFSGNGSSNVSGTFSLDGNTIDWYKNGNNVVLNVTDTIGTITTITVPLGDFGWIPPT